MFDKESLETLMLAEAITAANGRIQEVTAEGVVALPENYGTHDLETYMPNRRRARGTMTTVSDADFAAYVKAHKEPGAAVFVDDRDMTAKAVLNLGDPENPGHADNHAVLAPPQTAAFRALLAVANGRGQPQKTIAEFMEDWQDDIQCQGPDGAIPTHKAIAAIRKLTIEELRKQTAEVQSLSATKSAFESITASSTEKIPATVSFTCVPHVGLNKRTFVMRLGILTGEATPAPVLRIIKQELHKEEMAQELANRVREGLKGESIVVTVGTYERR